MAVSESTLAHDATIAAAGAPTPRMGGVTTTSSHSPILGLDDVSVSLGGLPVVRGVSAQVVDGEFVALLGPNGSGKTTLLRAILGLVPHDRGTVRLFGEPQARFHQWHRVGYVPQYVEPGLLNATVREVVGTGRLPLRKPFVPSRRADRQAVSEALADVGLTDKAGSQIGHLSGGQRRRAMIARALVAGPEMLVMDEPMAGVDLGTQESLAGLMRGLFHSRHLTVLVVLHEEGPFSGLVGRSLLLQDGRLVHDGPGFELAIPHEHHVPHAHARTDWIPTDPATVDPAWLRETDPDLRQED